MYKQYVHVQELQCLYLQEVKGAQIGDPWAIHDPSPPPHLIIQVFLKCINIKNVHGMNLF